MDVTMSNKGSQKHEMSDNPVFCGVVCEIEICNRVEV